MSRAGSCRYPIATSPQVSGVSAGVGIMWRLRAILIAAYIATTAGAQVMCSYNEVFRSPTDEGIKELPQDMINCVDQHSQDLYQDGEELALRLSCECIGRSLGPGAEDAVYECNEKDKYNLLHPGVHQVAESAGCASGLGGLPAIAAAYDCAYAGIDQLLDLDDRESLSVLSELSRVAGNVTACARGRRLSEKFAECIQDLLLPPDPAVRVFDGAICA